MGAGITLMIVGAILAFAVRRETPGIDVQTVGVILLVAGALVIAHARRGTRRERTVTRVEDPLGDEQAATHHTALGIDPTAPAGPTEPVDPAGPLGPLHPVDQRDPVGGAAPHDGRRTVREQVTDREIP